jgi:hypothetical protein
LFCLFKFNKTAFVSIMLIVFWNNYLFFVTGSEICSERLI